MSVVVDGLPPSVEDRPKTDAELFDLIHKLFGVGDWDADLDGPQKPWHKVRMTEIGKIKAIRRKRHYSIEDFAYLAQFCYQQHRRITKTFDLLEHWPDALRARTLNARSRIDHEIQAALELEQQREDGREWVERFLLAQGAGRIAALNRWKQERGPA